LPIDEMNIFLSIHFGEKQRAPHKGENEKAYTNYEFAFYKHEALGNLK